MKVLHISISDLVNGAGTSVAMQRLHGALQEACVDSQILCEWKTTDSPYSVAIERPFLIKKMEGLLGRISTRAGLNSIHCISSFGLAKSPLIAASDVLHFHCLHNNYFSYLALPAITQTTPAVYTIHDMWPITGHCAYSVDCERWRTGCGSCPHLDAYPAVTRDATHLEWKLKQWVFKHSNIAMVCPSKWVVDVAKQSLLSHLPIYHIPNGLNTKVFRPLDREKCRRIFNIPASHKVLMFSAANLSDKNKGCDLLTTALKLLPRSLHSTITLLLVGDKGVSVAHELGINAVATGYIRDEALMAAAYSAADIFLLPTRAETFGQVLAESSACGVPAVSFDVGGVPDVICDGESGYLARPNDALDFSHKIQTLLEDDGLRDRMGRRGREIAVKEFNLDLYLKRYLAVYESLSGKSVQEFEKILTPSV